MNLIITCPRHFEANTVNEITSIFERFGFKEPLITITSMPGILTVHTDTDSEQVVQKIMELVREEPWVIRYSKRIIPIQKSTKSTINEIVNGIKQISTAIREEQTYRITVEKRHSNLSSKEIITEIAKFVPNKVSLDNPDWIVLVEILGPDTGIAVVSPDHIISIEKMKRRLSE